MKWILGLLVAVSLNAHAFTNIMVPSIIECSEERLSDFEPSNNTEVFRFANAIEVTSLELPYGDPALWSLLYLTKIEFPSPQGPKCYLLENALLMNASSIDYSSELGRLLALEILVATYDDEAQIGQTLLTVRLRINQADGTLKFD